MSRLFKSGTTVYAGLQTAKGIVKALTGADTVQFLKGSKLLWPKGEMIDSEINTDSRNPAPKIVSGMWGEGGLETQLRGSGVAGTEPTGVAALLTCLFGTMVSNAAGTVEAASGAAAGFDSDLDFAVGQLVRIDVKGDGTVFDIRRIITKVGGAAPWAYTVQRNFSSVPVDDCVIAAGVSFLNTGSETEKYLTIEQFVKTHKHLFTDASIDGMTISLAAKQLVKIAFEIRAGSYAKSAASDAYNRVIDPTQGLTANNLNMLIDGVSSNMKQTDVSLKTRDEFTGVNDNGLGDRDWLNEFDQTGKVTPKVEDFSFFDTFFAGTLANIEMTAGSVVGNMMHIEQAGCQYTGPDVSDDNGAFMWDLPYLITGGIFIGFF
jgi:hypothetical protein